MVPKRVHARAGDAVVAGAVGGQRREGGALHRQGVAHGGVPAQSVVLQERLIGGQIGEVLRAAQLQRLAQAELEMTVSRLHRSVLVGETGIVAGRLQAVVPAEGGVGLGFVVAGGEVAVGGREPIGAVLAGHAAELPEGILQTFGERGEALPPQIALSERQPE